MASHKPAWMTRGSLTHKKQSDDASSYKCQKCLQLGHFTYQCSNKRKYASRVTRTQILEKKIEEIEKSKLTEAAKIDLPESELQPPTKKSKLSKQVIPKADELSDLSSHSNQESDSESSDSNSSSSSSTSTSSTSSTSSSDEPAKATHCKRKK